MINFGLFKNNVSPYLSRNIQADQSGSSMISKVQEGYTHITSNNLQVVADAIDEIYTVKKKNIANK